MIFRKIPFLRIERESCEKVFNQLGATLIVPLIYEDQLTGMISLGRKKSGKFYRREDINLLNTLANQGAVAIENARMVEEVIEKERMEEELNIARDLQISMLPADTPANCTDLRLPPFRCPPGRWGEISMILSTWAQIKPAWSSGMLPAKAFPVRWSCPPREVVSHAVGR